MQTLAALPVISIFYLGINALLLMVLAAYIVYLRTTLKVNMGDGGHASLQRAIRVQGNALEYVPMVVVMMLALEMSGLESLQLHIMGLGITLGRILHAVGLGRNSGKSAGRWFGTLFTWLVFIYAAVMCLKVSLFHI